MSRAEIISEYGSEGITRHARSYGKLAAITDDTQMALFTAEGLLRAYVRSRERGLPPAFTSVTAHALLRWLVTQGEPPSRGLDVKADGWLIQQAELHARRAPGNTCLSALRNMPDFDTPANNDSKGCGGVMRVAPVGMLAATIMADLPEGEFNQQVLELGRDSAAITHGHATGQLPAGVLSLIVAWVLRGKSIGEAATKALNALRDYRQHEETSVALRAALDLAQSEPADPGVVSQLGRGWVAEEALAIGLYCALSARNFADGVIMAVNHSGDSDSTGAIAGNILGAAMGVQSIPEDWLVPLELRPTLEQVADDLATVHLWDIGEYSTGPEAAHHWDRYPGY
jgi:ADP-ribosylglycohydrolase